MPDLEKLEEARLALLGKLDSARTQAERNRQGQFATPPILASEIVACATSMLPPETRIRFLEPGFGTGPFYSALLRSIARARIGTAVGYETDLHYAEPVERLWRDTGLVLHFDDFTMVEPPATGEEKYNLLVCNPPYVRHHHLSPPAKRRLQAKVARHTNFEMNGLGGLYTYFLVLSQAWMQEGGAGAWLVPSEFMDVNYGRKVKEFLLEKVTLERIHRFDPSEVQFEDALVSSAVVFFRNLPPPSEHEIEFTFGGSLSKPARVKRVARESLRHIHKWTGLHNGVSLSSGKPDGLRLSSLFNIKRGIATGCNSFFILTAERASRLGLPKAFLTPILPSPRKLEVDEVPADEEGDPRIRHRGYLLSCDLPEHEVRRKYPSLWAYLESGMEEGVHARYLCRHREPWYSQERRLPAPFLCTYMGRRTTERQAPFRFILNHSRAIAANVYLMLYPKPALLALAGDDEEARRGIWEALSRIATDLLVGNGRVYGGGLYKLEPKELANVPADVLFDIFPSRPNPAQQTQMFS